MKKIPIDITSLIQIFNEGKPRTQTLMRKSVKGSLSEIDWKIHKFVGYKWLVWVRDALIWICDAQVAVDVVLVQHH